MAKCSRCYEALHDFQWALKPHKQTIVQVCLECLKKELTSTPQRVVEPPSPDPNMGHDPACLVVAPWSKWRCCKDVTPTTVSDSTTQMDNKGDEK